MTTTRSLNTRTHHQEPEEGVSRKLLLSRQTVAKLLDVSVDVLDRLREEDPRFPAVVKIRPGMVHWTRRSIENYVQGKAEQSRRNEDR